MRLTISRGVRGFSGLAMASAKERRAAFDRWDCNGNGGLSLAEIDKAVGELYPEFAHKPALMRAYKAADVSADGFVSCCRLPRQSPSFAQRNTTDLDCGSLSQNR